VIDYQTLVTNLILMILGAIGTAAVWAIQKVFKLRRDIDWAFVKIRSLEEEVYGDRDAGKGCNQSIGKTTY
jgi:hypothetical protein